MQPPLPSNDINVRSTHYWLAHTMGVCPSCRINTRLFAIVLPAGHETLDDGAELDELTDPEVWSTAKGPALLFFVSSLAAAVARRVVGITDAYRLALDEAGRALYWANHCEQCGTMLDDHELYCEPDGVFTPMNAVRAEVIHVLRIDEAFEADAGGYEPEPIFFDALRKG